MKIYTKTGDKGLTSLVTGTRVSKNHERIEAYGTVDELNAYVGLLRDAIETETTKDALKSIQDCLFVIGSNLATDDKTTSIKIPSIHLDDISFLETEIDKMDAVLEPMRYFILPGGHTTVSFCHIARTVCRRAERRAYQLLEKNPVDEKLLVYLNRLSDYLFVLARILTKDFCVEETQWRPRK
jgi:cob(I)alamin adenosyltransferase